jgi:hypothetical protein
VPAGKLAHIGTTIKADPASPVPTPEQIGAPPAREVARESA